MTDIASPPLAFGVLAVGAAVAFPATAVADDAPPDPLPVPGDPACPRPRVRRCPGMGQLGPTGLDVLAQSNAAPATPGALGAPPVVGLDRDTLLGQNPVPVGARRRDRDAAEPQRVQQRLRRRGSSTTCRRRPGKGQQFGVAPGDENADVRKGKWFGRWIDLQRAGGPTAAARADAAAATR